MATRTPRRTVAKTDATTLAPDADIVSETIPTPEASMTAVAEIAAADVAPEMAAPVEVAPAETVTETVETDPVAHAVEEVVPATEAEPAAATAAEPEPAAVPAPVAKTNPVIDQPKLNMTVNVDQAIANTKQKVEKMSKQVFSTFEDVAGFQKDNVEAIVASSTILTKGFEALTKEFVAFTQAQYEQSVTATKAIMAVKSVKELVDLQTEFAKTSFDALVAEATKVSETSMKVANEAAQPITARVNATVEKLSKLKAA